MKTTFTSEKIGNVRCVTIQRGDILKGGLRLSVYDSSIGRTYLVCVPTDGLTRRSVHISRDDAKRLFS